jgi:hypothetical protein
MIGLREMKSPASLSPTPEWHAEVRRLFGPFALFCDLGFSGLRVARTGGGRSVAGMRLAGFVAIAVVFVGACVTAAAGEPAASLAHYARVEIAPTRTSIYLGTVSMTMPTFVRQHDGVYTADYTAKVFPFFFYNETGRLSVSVSDGALRQLERGEAIDFEGRAVNADGDERRITGRAVPLDARAGKIKVRVFLSKRIQLIFNTTYRFVDENGGRGHPPASSGPVKAPRPPRTAPAPRVAARSR